MPASAEINWNTLLDEATELLRRYIRIDTSNPPGRERAACEFLAEILAKEEVPTALYDPGDDRVSLRAVLRGDGTKKPMMLLNHTDVVPVEREYWDVDPFGGVLQDRHIWGRGALDMKGLAIVQLLTVLTLKRRRVPLARDVVFFAQADEEAGSERGMRWIAQRHPETLDAEYVITEGGGGITEMFGVRRPVYTIAVGEKGPVWLRLVAEGRAGHGSLPLEDNAIDRLVRALWRVQQWQRDLVVPPVLHESFARFRKAGLIDVDPTPAGIRQLANGDPRIRALLTSTISVTTAKAGVKHNVIPASAEVTLDCRLRPGQDAQDFIASLCHVIDDPSVRVEPIHIRSSSINSHETELFTVIEQVLQERVEGAIVVPGITLGFTDSSELRNRGQISYGFSGGLESPELAGTIHGHNERVSLESLKLNLEVLYEVTRRMCAAS